MKQTGMVTFGTTEFNLLRRYPSLFRASSCVSDSSGPSVNFGPGEIDYLFSAWLWLPAFPRAK